MANYLLNTRGGSRKPSKSAPVADVQTVQVSNDPTMKKWEVRRGQYVAGIIEGFGFDDIPSYRAYGRAYGLNPMNHLGSFPSLKAAVSAVTNLK